MAKRKYLALITTLLPGLVAASPWLPDEGDYHLISSAYITDKTAEKRLNEESEAYYVLEQEIGDLEASKYKYNYSQLTPEALANRIKATEGRIKNLKRLQSAFPRHYPLRTLSQTLEYGISDKYSFNFKAFSQLKENFAGNEHSSTSFETGPKIKLKQGEKYIISLQPSLGVQRSGLGSNHMSGEVRLLLGRASKHKLGKAFNTLEIAPGFTGDSLEYRMDYTTGIETKGDMILTLQTYNSFRPKASKLYKQTSLEQFAVAKPLMISYDSRSKITLQAGWFYEYSISARKALTSGVQFSIWVQI